MINTEQVYEQSRQSSTSLSRNQACLVCRKRKVKCDAVKPTCGACKRSAIAQNIDVRNTQCVYPNISHGASSSRCNKETYNDSDDIFQFTFQQREGIESSMVFDEGNNSRRKRQRDALMPPPSHNSTLSSPQSNESESIRVGELENKIASLEKQLAMLSASFSFSAAEKNVTNDYMNSSDNMNNESDTNSTMLSRFSSATSSTSQSNSSPEDDILLSMEITSSATTNIMAPLILDNDLFGSNSFPSFISSPTQSQPILLPTTTSLNTTTVNSHTLDLNSFFSMRVPTPPPFGFDDTEYIHMLNEKQQSPQHQQYYSPEQQQQNTFILDDGDMNEHNVSTALINPSTFIPVGWPTSLPSPKVTHRLLSTFFTGQGYLSLGIGVVNRETFYNAIGRSPLSAHFPQQYLIHCICAIGSKYASLTELGLDVERYWENFETPEIYHAMEVKHRIDTCHSQAKIDFQLIQSIALLCFAFIKPNSFYAENLWNSLGIAIRATIRFSLNHLEGTYTVDEQGKSSKSIQSELPAPVNESERRSRAFTLWLTHSCEAICSLSTGRAQLLIFEDISTLLPEKAENTGPLQNPVVNFDALSPDSPNFYSSHPPNLVGPVQLYFKSITLLSQGLTFVQRYTARLAVKGQMKQPTDMRRLAGFKKVEDAVLLFQNSIPDQYKLVDEKSDMLLVLTHMISHTTLILLYEKLCRNRIGDMPSSKCVQAGAVIHKIVRSAIGNTGRRATYHEAIILSITERVYKEQVIRNQRLGENDEAEETQKELMKITELASSVKDDYSHYPELFKLC